MTLTNVHVGLGERAYNISIGPGALAAAAPTVAAMAGAGQIVIVADQSVWDIHSQRIAAHFPNAPVITIPSGEASKSYTQYSALCDALLDTGIGRDGLILAVGGGVVGDLAGFAAATLRRGCRFVQIPTTLLAQVDSSVGGKTAINSPLGKNLIGVFHQPSLVIADNTLLETLPERELKAGYAEVVKYGLLGNADFFDWLESNGPAVLALDQAALTNAVKTSCEMKAEIVAADETEKGVRALLNLGHTFGHALEAVMGFDGRLLHGEAVAIGMGMAFRFAAREGIAPAADADRMAAHLRALGLMAAPHEIDGLSTSADEQLDKMYQDKKVEGGALTLILPRGIGETFLTRTIDPERVRAFLRDEIGR